MSETEPTAGMTGALDLWRKSIASIADAVAVPMLIWISWQAFFGGTQPFQIEAWWVGLAGAVACLAMPGAARHVPLAMVLWALLGLASSATHRWAVVAASNDLAWWEVFRPGSHLIVMIVFSLAVSHVLRTPRRLAWFGVLLALAIVVIAAQLLFDRVRTGFIYAEAGSVSMPSVFQWSGLHQIGFLFVIGLPLVMAVAGYARHWTQVGAALVLATFLITVAFLNGSRSAILTMAIVTLLMLGAAFRASAQKRWIRAVFGAAMVVLPAVLWYAFTHITTSMRALASWSGGRIPIWEAGWRIAIDHPWIGVGPGNYMHTMLNEGYAERYLPWWSTRHIAFTHAHNQFLQAGADTGLPSMLCLLALWGWMVHACAQGLRDPRIRVVSLGMLFVFVGLFLRLNYDSLLDNVIGYDRVSIVMWLVFGAAMAIKGQARRPA